MPQNSYRARMTCKTRWELTLSFTGRPAPATEDRPEHTQQSGLLSRLFGRRPKPGGPARHWSAGEVDRAVKDVVKALASLPHVRSTDPYSATFNISGAMLRDIPRVLCEVSETLPVVPSELVWFTERFASPHDAEWYIVRPRAWQAPACDETLPGVHIWGARAATVSEYTRHSIESAGLTGCSFVWKADRPRFHAPPLYYLVAHQPIGRGIDHPAADVQSIVARSRYGQSTDTPLDGDYRRAHTSFTREQIRDFAMLNLPFDPSELSALEGHRIHFQTNARFLRRDLPDTDFAFWWEQDALCAQLPRHESIPRDRLLCASHRAAHLLLDNALITKSELEPVLILDRLPPKCADLASSCGILPPPMLCPEEETEWNTRYENEWQSIRFNPPPQRTNSIESFRCILSENHHLVAEWDRFDHERYMSELGRSQHSMPRAWLEVLPFLAQSGYCNDSGVEYELCTAGFDRGFVEFNAMVRESYPNATEQYLPFAGNGCGDDFAFVVNAPTMPDDAPIIRWDHETLEFSRRWENIAQWVEEVCMPVMIVKWNNGKGPDSQAT